MDREGTLYEPVENLDIFSWWWFSEINLFRRVHTYRGPSYSVRQ